MTNPNSITITQTHPPACLGGNGRGHWAAKARAAEVTKINAALWTRQFSSVWDVVCSKLNKYSLTWYYKGKRPDDDNVLTRCKYIKDGMCKALAIDDGQLSLSAIKLIHCKYRAGEVDFTIFEEKP